MIGVPGSFAETVYSALHHCRAATNAVERHGNPESAVVMAMDSHLRIAHMRRNRAHYFRKFVGHRAAVGVAKADEFRAAALGRVEGFERIFWIVLESVEEMLGVVNNLAAVFDEIRDGFLNHFKIFLGGGFYDLLDMQKPGFAEYRHIGRFGREKQRYLIVFRNFRVCAARRTEGRYFRMRKFYIFYLLKEGHIARIRSR